jgi:ubiquinone/menaquinone biosynthesis C-methylase UbiE
MRDPAEFWDEHADGYAKKPIKNVESYHETLERTRKHLSASDHVLELGCGTGTTALLLAPCVKHIRASDISSRMIAIAREKAATQGVCNVRFERATPFDDDLEKGAFDAVLAFNLLHLLEDVPGAVRRVHELLKPGGSFVSKTICLAEQSRLWRPVLAVARSLGLAPSVHCLKVAELEDMITRNGFELIESGFHPRSPPSRFLVARRS